MVWGKKNFMELDGKIKPYSLTNGSSKQTVGSNENFSFNLRMANEECAWLYKNCQLSCIVTFN